MTSPSCGSWVAIQTRPLREDCVRACLESKGYEVFLPGRSGTASRRTQRPRRPLALFPGYLFCRWMSDLKSKVVTTPGVVRIVGVGKVPEPVREEEIANIRKLVESGISIRSCLQVPSGSTVEITSGPLRGAVGLVVTAPAAQEFVVSINLLRRHLAVTLDKGTEFVIRSGIGSS